MLRYYLLTAVAAAVLVALMPVTVRFRYQREHQDDHLMVCWRPFGAIPVAKLELPVIRVQMEGLEPVLKVFGELEAVHQRPAVKTEVKVKRPPWHVFPKLIRLTPELMLAMMKMLSINRRLLKRVCCTKLRWETEFGLGDAALTGITAGNLWAVKGIFYQVLSNTIMLRPERDHLKVIPNFDQRTLRLNFDCILRFRFGYIIIAALRIIRLAVNFFLSVVQSKGVRAWQKIIRFNH